MRFDWSKILIAAMAVFIIFIVSMGIKMATSSQALYEDDYYEQGEMHSVRMEQEQAGEKVSVSYNRAKNALIVAFDSVGYVEAYKLVFLADNTKDFEELGIMPEPTNEQHVIIPRNLESGIWYLEVKGITNGKTFFKKQQFVK